MISANDSLHLAQWQARLQDAVDCVLDAGLQAEVTTHIQSCAACRNEHAKLLSLHDNLKLQFAGTPKLSHDFSARVLATVDEQEHARRAQAKYQAEREFRKRMRAFSLDWRDLWQRHAGSIVAALAVIVAAVTSLGSLWETLRERITDSIVVLPDPQAKIMVSVVALLASFSVSAAIVWFLRTKSR